MAEVTRTGVPTPVNVMAVRTRSITGLYAGEALAGGDAVYIKASDGFVYKADGSAADEAASCKGFAAKVASAGEACTILRNGVHLAYGPNVAGTPSNPGARLYLSATVPGNLSDAATTGDSVGVAFVIDVDGRIEIDVPPKMTDAIA
jgi:hypothetical protein